VQHTSRIQSTGSSWAVRPSVYAAAAGVVLASVALAFPAHRLMPQTGLSLLFLTGVLIVAARTGQACRYLVKDFGTSKSPKSTRQRGSHNAPAALRPPGSARCASHGSHNDSTALGCVYRTSLRAAAKTPGAYRRLSASCFALPWRTAEDCSAFTRVMACTFAGSSEMTLYIRLQSLRYLHDCSDCFRLEQHRRVGLSPTGKRRLCTAHTQSGSSAFYLGRVIP
jgi:hypothetical protein